MHLLVFLTLVYGSTGFCQNRQHQFELEATLVEDEIYLIDVFLPDDFDSAKIYPVLYITDWWWYKEYDPQMYRRLRYANDIEPIILVGIGTIGDGTDWSLERRRDLTPTHVLDQDRQDPLNLGSRGITGGAESFLNFLEDELIPIIESTYHSDTLNRGFAGYSFGGLFGAYILLYKPQLFQKYLLGSPSLDYDNYLLIDRLKEINSEELKSIKSIFISVGGEELGKDLKSYADLRDLILTMDLPDLNFKSIVIEGEGHRSAIIPTLTKGLRFLYGEN